MTVTYHDAAARATVRCPSGKIGTLIYVPPRDGDAITRRAKRSTGRKARVRLDGAVISIDPTLLEVVG